LNPIKGNIAANASIKSSALLQLLRDDARK
jgi:hypothetical protein